MDLGIKGRVAVITGGDSGIGLRTAEFLLREGVRVVLSDKEPEALAQAAGHLRGLGDVTAVPADLLEPADVEALRARAEAACGPVHILVNAAGITGPTGDFLTITDAQWREALEADLLAAVRVCRAFIPGMRAQGWGRIVVIGSEDAVQPYAEELPYCAAKAGLINLAKGLSKAYGPDGVLVNAVSPAYIETPMTDAMMEKRAAERGTDVAEAVRSFLTENRPGIVMRRRGRPEEVASAIAYLCSEHASFVTGANLRVDGGAVHTMSV
ncbi:(S)-1-Phenylethanol dehydrogenase [Methylobacterium crusticola]|uniref:(S)-1-Phenylethanol dehydrogenase n=1 Tax=Methylobacterium crusticola TaxID=1697972 RepID=A0ABQ4R9V4_9HYPH|nr:SDR family oxidoreductase [Methylobacterium crusticola]GJD53960.1 (S)-1-Phenylethanol dehydrogenase [Methylobacterium crusticola]